MINDKGILIKNIFYMLTYSFQVLKQSTYERVSSESFESVENLFAAILNRGVSHILKQGLYKEYVEIKDNLQRIKGKLDVNQTIKNRINNSNLVGCKFDELSVDNKFNRIIKTTMTHLLNLKEVADIQKKQLKQNISLMGEVTEIVNLKTIRWDTLHFHSNNQTYKMLINICYFIMNSLIQTDESGKYKMMKFTDEYMAKVYEKFVLEYYRKHHPEVSTSSKKIDWNIDEINQTALMFLPEMKSDIMLKKCEKTLIIDTKYYGKILTNYREKQSYISNNLYQIHTYVKNYDKEKTGKVSGLLLYAQTENDDLKEGEIKLDGNMFVIKTLDLNQSFKCITNQLDEIIIKYL